jgi:folate-binding protein YgfZ
VAKAFVDLSAWRKIGVTGADSIAWLNDLLTADLSGLGPNRSQRALLLTPTGSIRADVTVAIPGGSVVLFQDPAQPQPIERLLAPYVLSSDVELDDRTAELCLFALLDATAPPNAPGTASTTPSCLGPGFDLTALGEDHDRVFRSLSKVFAETSEAEAEPWRVMTGVPRFGVDALPEDLPQEAGLSAAVSFGKGCYLGQEAVAKVQNLGHPRRLVVALEADGALGAGDVLLMEGREAGRVTSAARDDHGTVALGRVRWDSRHGPFQTTGGHLVRLRSLATVNRVS